MYPRPLVVIGPLVGKLFRRHPAEIQAGTLRYIRFLANDPCAGVRNADDLIRILGTVNADGYLGAILDFNPGFSEKRLMLKPLLPELLAQDNHSISVNLGSE